jgi:hypothetical protein
LYAAAPLFPSAGRLNSDPLWILHPSINTYGDPLWEVLRTIYGGGRPHASDFVSVLIHKTA